MIDFKLGDKFKVKKDKIGPFPGSESSIFTLIGSSGINNKRGMSNICVFSLKVDPKNVDKFLSFSKIALDFYSKLDYKFCNNVEKFFNTSYFDLYYDNINHYLYPIDNNISCRKN
jgi:hypothetical protein